MAKTKVRPHPGALTELLKSRDMTQVDAKSVSGIDRKTLARINRGEEVKVETLQTLANRLKVPTTYFDPPAGNSVDQVDGQRENDPGYVNLMLRQVENADDLVAMLLFTNQIKWRLNVHALDDETIPLLEQLEDAVKDLHEYLNNPNFDDSLREQLDKLKKIKRVVTLIEELAKHRLAILGAGYLYWQSHKDTDFFTERPCINFESRTNVLLSIEEHPAHERREKVYQGTVPPKFNSDSTTIVNVNGKTLAMDPTIDDEIPF